MSQPDESHADFDLPMSEDDVWPTDDEMNLDNEKAPAEQQLPGAMTPPTKEDGMPAVDHNTRHERREALIHLGYAIDKIAAARLSLGTATFHARKADLLPGSSLVLDGGNQTLDSMLDMLRAEKTELVESLLAEQAAR